MPGRDLPGRIRVVNHGVLGWRLSGAGGKEQVAEEPDESCVICDPVDPLAIACNDSAKAGQLSQEIYAFTGKDSGDYAPSTLAQFAQGEKAVVERCSKCWVILVTPPDFRKDGVHAGKPITREQAVDELAHGIASMVSKAWKMPDVRKVRFSPIGQGVLSGKCKGKKFVNFFVDAVLPIHLLHPPSSPNTNPTLLYPTLLDRLGAINRYHSLHLLQWWHSLFHTLPPSS